MGFIMIILLLLGIATLIIIGLYRSRRKLQEELSLREGAETDETERSLQEEHSKLYSMVLEHLHKGRIKEGMKREEIYDLLMADDKKEEVFKYTYLYFNPDRKPEETFTLKGFRKGLPTPKLTIEMKDGKLVSWRSVV